MWSNPKDQAATSADCRPLIGTSRAFHAHLGAVNDHCVQRRCEGVDHLPRIAFFDVDEGAGDFQSAQQLTNRAASPVAHFDAQRWQVALDPTRRRAAGRRRIGRCDVKLGAGALCEQRGVPDDPFVVIRIRIVRRIDRNQDPFRPTGRGNVTDAHAAHDAFNHVLHKPILLLPPGIALGGFRIR